jgi:hypothetical protein
VRKPRDRPYQGQERTAFGNGSGDGDVWVMLADTRLPLWSTRPNLFQLVADLRGIAPIRRAVAGRPRFTSAPQAGVAFYQTVRKVTS